MSYVKTLRAIKTFVHELNSVHGSDHKELRLYNHLLQKTEFHNKKSMKKHVKIFRNFCAKNRECIVEKSHEDMKFGVISYSNNVKIPIKQIIEKSDAETRSAVWEHLLCILALTNPSTDALNLIKKSLQQGSPGSNTQNEQDFLGQMMGNIQKHLASSPAAAGQNPMMMLGSLFQSGMVQNLMSDMQQGVKSGKLNVKTMVNSMKTMLDTVTDKMDELEEAKAGAKTGEGVNDKTKPVQPSVSQEEAVQPIVSQEEAVQSSVSDAANLLMKLTEVKEESV